MSDQLAKKEEALLTDQARKAKAFDWLSETLQESPIEIYVDSSGVVLNVTCEFGRSTGLTLLDTVEKAMGLSSPEAGTVNEKKEPSSRE